MSDRGGSTNSDKPVFNQVNKGNPAGRGGATQSTGIGPVGSASLSSGSTNPVPKGTGGKQPAC